MYLHWWISQSQRSGTVDTVVNNEEQDNKLSALAVEGSGPNFTEKRLTESMETRLEGIF